MTKFDEKMESIETSLEEANYDLSRPGNLISCVQGLLEIIRQQNQEIETLKLQMAGVQMRETLQPSFYGTPTNLD